MLQKKWGITTTVVIMLVGVIYVYACGSGQCKDHDKHDHNTGMEEKKDDTVKTPDNLIKQADKLLKEADKAKDAKPLMAHCQEMLTAATKEIASAFGGQETIDAALAAKSNQTAIKLMKKSLELAEKCQSMLPKPAEEKTLYVCPMGCIEPTDKPGKCPKCGMNLEKQK